MPILYGLFTFWVKPFEIFSQPHNWVLFPIFLATERCLCYANLVWIIYILIQAFLNLLSTTQLSFVCYFLSNWKVSMLCQTCMDYFHIDSSLSNSFVNHTIQFCLLFLRNWNVSMLCQTCMDCFHYESSLSKSFVTTQLSFVCYFLATERCLCYANLVWIIYILSQAFRTLLSTTQFSFVCYFLETEMCLCYANLVWIIYILSQAFPNLLSTTQLSFVCYFLSNWKVSMLCQTRMDYLHFESSFSKSFVNHITQFCLLFS